MANWTVGRKLFTGVGVLLGMLAITGWLGVRTAADIKANLDVATQQTAKKIDLAHRIQENVVRMRSEQRRALLAGFGNDPETVKAADGRITELLELNGKRLDEIGTLLVSEQGKKNVADIRQVEKEWGQVNTEALALIRKGEHQHAWELARERANPLIDRIDGYGDELLAQQDRFLAESTEASDASYSRARLTLVAFVALAVGVGLIVGWVVRTITTALRETAQSLREGAEQVAAASSQVAVSAQTLSQGATEQAASLEETSASMEEMASMTRSNAEGAQRAATLMVTVEQQLGHANGKLAEMVQSMSEIRDSSGRVAKIIKTIDEIAFQTNILALNAAVEAARAGEAGMGFAVVADEVRNLAQRAAEAARNTAELIETSGRSAEQGASRVSEVAGAIQQFTASVSEVRSITEQVSSASEQQRQGIEQVSQAVAQMEKVTQSSAATAEESAAASEELNAQADTSMSFVARLDAMVGGSRTPDQAATRQGARRKSGGKVVALKRNQPARDADDTMPATGTFGQW